MDILTAATGWISWFLGFAIPFLIVLTVVVFVHELGHFLVARWCGVRIEAFSIGFGSEIFGFHDRNGTRWKVCWIPLGGYVKFAGDENAASQPVTSEQMDRFTETERREIFHAKPVGQRAAIVAAGPIANFILAILIYAVVFSTYGRPVLEPRVDSVTPGSAAEAAGFQVGDVVLSVDGREIETFQQLQVIVSTSNGRTLPIVVRRDGMERTFEATPRLTDPPEGAQRRDRVFVLGLGNNPRNQQTATFRTYDPVTAIGLGVRETWFVVDRTIVFIRDLFTGRGNVRDLGGPIRIAEVSGQAAAISWISLVMLTAVLSISIGLLNLFPIPMLDGGHLVFYALEAARGRPLSERSQEIGFRVGLALVLTLMVVATWNDIARLVGS